MYGDMSPRMPEMLQRCQNVCYAIILRGLGKTDRAKNLLEQNLTLDSGFDHPLTTIALLELATIAASKGQIDEVEIRSGQASLLAARLNQIDLLAESLPMLTEAADTLKPGEGLKIAEAVLRWVDADFGLPYLTTTATACRSAARDRNTAAFESQEPRFNRLAKNREIQLPHLQAMVYAAQIKHFATKGNANASQTAWKQLVNIATGGSSPSPLLPKLLQATSIQLALNEGGVPKSTLMEKLNALVQRPSDAEWLLSPWQSLVWRTFHSMTYINF